MTVQPTIDDQLHGAQRLLDLVAADTGLSTASQESLVNVGRLLKQVRRSWSTLLPFLTEDNAALTTLLERVAPVAGGTVAAEVATASSTPTTGSGVEVAPVSAHNAALRALLSRVIDGLPDSDRGRAARD